MSSRHGWCLFAAAGSASALVCAVARAAVEDCASVVVEADEAVLAASPELPERIRHAFAGRDDMDRCARVALRASHAAIAMEVIVADGRTASRTVARVDDVLPVLEALLALPEAPEAPEPERSRVEREGAVSLAPRATPAPAVPDELGAQAGERRHVVNFELSAFTSARAGVGQYSVGFGLLPLLGVSNWLLGIGARVDSYTVVQGSPESTPRFMALGGHRFRFGATSLDLLGGPAFTLQGDATAEVETQSNGSLERERTITTSDMTPRLLLASHLNFATRSLVRGFVGVESEVRLGREAPEVPEDRSLPGWMVGLALGGTVGTR